jgi:hypothetical protein
MKVREPFEKFVYSPYYSESELCGGVVTVSFSKYLPLASDAFLTTLHPLFENVLQTFCRKLQEGSGRDGFDLLTTSKFLASELPFHGWESPEIAWGEIWNLWRLF